MEGFSSSSAKDPVRDDALNGVVESTTNTSSQSSSSSSQVPPMKKEKEGSAEGFPPLSVSSWPSPLPSYNNNYYNYNINYNYNYNYNMIPPQYSCMQQQIYYHNNYYNYIPTLPPASHFLPSPYIIGDNSFYTYNTPYFAPPPLPPPPPELQRRTALRHKIAKQIDYYFSDDNLAKDLYLRKRMDEEGWVPITLIAGFKQVSKLSKDTKFVFESLMYSEIVEVQDRELSKGTKDRDDEEVQRQKVRRRGNWKKWLLKNLPKPES